MGANKRLQLGVFVRGQGHRARKRNGHGPGPYRERGRRNMTRACLSFYTLFTQNVLAQDLRNGHLAVSGLAAHENGTNDIGLDGFEDVFGLKNVINTRNAGGQHETGGGLWLLPHDFELLDRHGPDVLAGPTEIRQGLIEEKTRNGI